MGGRLMRALVYGMGVTAKRAAASSVAGPVLRDDDPRWVPVNARRSTTSTCSFRARVCLSIIP